jgi:hypothetical protein
VPILRLGLLAALRRDRETSRIHGALEELSRTGRFQQRQPPVSAEREESKVAACKTGMSGARVPFVTLE